MGTGKLYNVTDFLSIKNALLDKYGVYDVSTNPNGVIVYYQSTNSVIFKCLRLCDKVIRLFDMNFYAQYGDSWSAGDAINNPVLFGGSNYTNSQMTGTYLALSDNALVLNKYFVGNTTNDRIILIGKLSNQKYAVMGAYGNPSYCVGTRCIITSTGEEFYPITSFHNLLSSLGEIYKSNMYISKKIGGLSEYNTDGTLAYLLDVYSVFYGAIHPVIGSKYIITSGTLYMEGASTIRIANSLLIELI